MMGRQWRRERLSERGAAAIEFALVVPFLLLLLLGIVSYGFMLSFRQTLSQAATEGARAGAVTPLRTDKPVNARTAVNEAMSAFGVTCNGNNLLRDGGSVGRCTVTGPGPCNPVAAGVECMQITLTYDYANHPLTPAFPGLGLVLPDTLTYSAQARVS